jgi:sugar phosphate isomerase/epimerase
MSRKIVIQTQLWGNANLGVDFVPIFDDVLKAGYDGVESNVVVMSQKDKLHRYLAENPLKVFALHSGLPPYYDGEIKPEYNVLLADMSRFGIGHLLFSPGRRTTMEDEHKLLAIVDRLGDRAADRGIRLLYHNHGWEFERFGYDLFDAVTEFKHIGLALDTGWLYRAGYPLKQTVDRYRGQIEYIHLKDTTADEWKELGSGDANVAETIRELNTPELKIWTVEQDNSQLPPLESATISLNYLKKRLDELDGKSGDRLA